MDYYYYLKKMEKKSKNYVAQKKRPDIRLTKKEFLNILPIKPILSRAVLSFTTSELQNLIVFGTELRIFEYQLDKE